MCIVSMVFDRYEPVWPKPNQTDIFEKQIEHLMQKRVSLDTQKDAVKLFKEIVKLTKQLDTLLGLEDCEDPKKMEWFNKIKEAIIEAEKTKLENELSL